MLEDHGTTCDLPEFLKPGQPVTSLRNIPFVYNRCEKPIAMRFVEKKPDTRLASGRREDPHHRGGRGMRPSAVAVIHRTIKPLSVRIITFLKFRFRVLFRRHSQIKRAK